MKTMMNNVISPLFKKTAYALGMFSLLTTLTGGEAKADRLNGEFAPSQGTWTQIASACTPDEESIDYQFSGAGVSFPVSVTGDITLRCNITNVMDPDLPWTILARIIHEKAGRNGSALLRFEVVKTFRPSAEERADDRVYCTTFLRLPSNRPDYRSF
jgi:hypothetical protein